MATMHPDKTVMWLRYALGIIFVWFGILKFFNASPVTPLINAVSPISFPLEIPLLGIFEILIGAGLFMKRLRGFSSVIMMGYLAVIIVLVFLRKGFAPWFPLLTFEGEFVLKDIVLIAAGLVVLSHKEETVPEENEISTQKKITKKA